jgi:Transposase IS66 family
LPPPCSGWIDSRKPFAAARLHGDDTTVPVLAKGKTDTGRLWTYVRDDRPFGGADPPAVFPAIAEATIPWGTLPVGTGFCRPTPMAAPEARGHPGSRLLGPQQAQSIRAGRYRSGGTQEGARREAQSGKRKILTARCSVFEQRRKKFALTNQRVTMD